MIWANVLCLSVFFVVADPIHSNQHTKKKNRNKFFLALTNISSIVLIDKQIDKTTEIIIESIDMEYMQWLGSRWKINERNSSPTK